MAQDKYALFLGCTVPVRNFQYELSVRRVLDKIGIGIQDLQGFGCCGFPIEAVHHDSSIALAARNLALAEKEGLDIMTLCSACTGHLAKTQKMLSDPANKEELEHVNKILADDGLEYKGKTKVIHFARVMYEQVGPEKVKELTTYSLEGIKVAPHYGCHYTKPSDIFDNFDSPIFPESLDKLIEATGATPVQYMDKMQCCGGGILAVGEETPTKMVNKKLTNIKTAGADAITLICPFCDIMYDEFQPTIEEKYQKEYNLPVLFLSQLLGLAMGLDPKKDLAVKKNQVKVKPLLEKLEAMRGESG